MDEHRAVMAALDRIEASPIASGPLPCGELRLLAQETRSLVERMRDAAEDILFEDHARLGFESEKPVVVAEESVSPTPKISPAEVARKAREALREVVLASNEPTNVLAERLNIGVVTVSTIRRKAGDRCAYLSGSALTAEQRKEIATSGEPVRVLAARHSVSESLVTKIRKAGWVF